MYKKENSYWENIGCEDIRDFLISYLGYNKENGYHAVSVKVAEGKFIVKLFFKRFQKYVWEFIPYMDSFFLGSFEEKIDVNLDGSLNGHWISFLVGIHGPRSDYFRNVVTSRGLLLLHNWSIEAPITAPPTVFGINEAKHLTPNEASSFIAKGKIVYAKGYLYGTKSGRVYNGEPYATSNLLEINGMFTTDSSKIAYILGEKAKSYT